MGPRRLWGTHSRPGAGPAAALQREIHTHGLFRTIDVAASNLARSKRAERAGISNLWYDHELEAEPSDLGTVASGAEWTRTTREGFSLGHSTVPVDVTAVDRLYCGTQIMQRLSSEGGD